MTCPALRVSGAELLSDESRRWGTNLLPALDMNFDAVREVFGSFLCAPEFDPRSNRKALPYSHLSFTPYAAQHTFVRGIAFLIP